MYRENLPRGTRTTILKFKVPRIIRYAQPENFWEKTFFKVMPDLNRLVAQCGSNGMHKFRKRLGVCQRMAEHMEKLSAAKISKDKTTKALEDMDEFYKMKKSVIVCLEIKEAFMVRRIIIHLENFELGTLYSILDTMTLSSHAFNHRDPMLI